MNIKAPVKCSSLKQKDVAASVLLRTEINGPFDVPILIILNQQNVSAVINI